MMLLVDYLEEAAEYLKEKMLTRNRLEQQYRRIYDRDLKREISLISKEIAKKRSEITGQLLVNLDEFRYLHKYFPELLQMFMDDEYIGKMIARKAWLLNYRPLDPQEAAMRLNQLKKARLQLKDAKRFLRTWTGNVEARAFSATFPVLKGRLKGTLEKDEVRRTIVETDKELRKAGWLLLISDTLITIPLSKFTNKLLKLQYEQMMANAEMESARGRGTVMELKALRNFEKVSRKRLHYQNVIAQILLANPEYLRRMKKKRHWLSREKRGILEKIAQDVTPRKVKERAWLNDMNKRLAIGVEKEPEKPRPKEKPKKKGKPKKAKKPEKASEAKKKRKKAPKPKGPRKK